MTALQAQWAIAKAQAQATLARLRDFDPNQPRDETGKWTDTGAGDGGAAEPAAAPGKLDPAVTDVGGDEWNQRTAERLEREYQAARPRVDKLAQESPGKTTTGAHTTTSDDDEEEVPFVAEEWEQLADIQQSEAEEQYISKVTPEYLDSEIENWSSEHAPSEARQQVADDFNNGQNIEWAEETLKQLRIDREEEGVKPIPYTDEQLLEAISIHYEAGSSKDPELTFDDDKLREPAGAPPPEQQTLPGIEEPDLSKHLTEEMRDDIETALLKAMETETDDVVDKLEPPEYLKESAEEYAGESWSSMDDSEKFEWTKKNTEIIEDESGGDAVATHDIMVTRLPDKFDPLNLRNDTTQYRLTQALATHLSIANARAVLAERKLPSLTDDATLIGVDKKMWGNWKGSSTSVDGMLLQLATADELGGRLNTRTRNEIKPDELKQYADRQYSAIGGYAGIKAYIRAKWEVTQYLLDRAGLKEVELYRGIGLDEELIAKWFSALAKHLQSGEKVQGGYTHLPTLHVARNGAASATVSPDVANDWGSSLNRVVLRALVPRTAALSIPAYGINIHSEREVVIAGTAWKGWDVWSEKAPTFDKVPLKHAA